MALFAAPIAHEDHAQRACYAALHLREAHRLFTEIGAPIRAADVAKELGLATAS